MPWKVSDIVSERVDFVQRARLEKGSFSRVCRDFGISRPTGYRWLGRYAAEEDVRAMDDRSRRPHESPLRVSPQSEERIEALREQYGWGAKKLHRILAEEGVVVSVATINRVLARRGLILPEDRHPQHTRRFERSAPNALWQMDFKGEWGAAQRCYPLSILDDHSRYLVGLDALPSTQGRGVQAVLERTMRHYGVPDEMLMDHGTPWWSTTNAQGLTFVSVGLIQQGIRLRYSGIGHPQTQGKVERMHRSLKHHLQFAGYPRPSQLDLCQQSLDRFRQVYNELRPHEALDLHRPAERYHSSPRQYTSVPTPYDYPAGTTVRHLNTQGCLEYGRRRYFICEALAREDVGLQLLDETILVRFRHMYIREIDLRTKTTRPLVLPTQPEDFAAPDRALQSGVSTRQEFTA
jgi:transposase InsO family protein